MALFLMRPKATFCLTPKVSVLVPVYNGGNYLAECLESILTQDFADCEILIADDNSTDPSPTLAQQYAAKDRRIRWWKNPRNLGLAANFNRCLREAKGQYIKYVLQDDKLLSPAAISQMVGWLDGNSSISLVASASLVINEHSHVVEARNPFQPGVWDGRKTILRCLEQPANLIGEPSLTMFRRAQAARGFDERYRQGLDIELWFHLLEQGNFAYLSKPLCAFRKHARQRSKAALFSANIR